MTTPRAHVLTEEDHLTAFLEKWIAVRVALVEKYRLQAERYRGRPEMRMCYDGARRSQRHYEHELRMIRLLAERATPYKLAT